MKIVLATRNAGKLREIQDILAGPQLEILSLREFPDCPEVVEDGATYLENARKKAVTVASHCGTWALADDSGLEVEALNGRPGLHSARFAGDGAGDAAHIQKMLQELSGVDVARRRAVFRCVLVLAHPDGRNFSAEGELWGRIAELPRGERGFGYDPIFLLPEQGRTLAELDPEAKNRISHRRRALEKMSGILAGLA